MPVQYFISFLSFSFFFLLIIKVPSYLSFTPSHSICWGQMLWFFPFYLWERQRWRMKGPISSVDQRCCPGASHQHHHCHSYVLFCTMSYLLIYSAPPPPTAPACRSLLILPIKINLRLKIPTLAHQRGRNRGGGGLARSAALSLTSVFLTKVSRFNYWAGKNSITNTLLKVRSWSHLRPNLVYASACRCFLPPISGDSDEQHAGSEHEEAKLDEIRQAQCVKPRK